MNPFEIGTPSVFSVSSPFQALCGVATIHQLEIENYIFIVRLRNEKTRNAQIENVLQQFGIKYKAVYYNRINKWILIARSLQKKSNRYKRLFIGDYRDTQNIVIGCGYVSDRSDIVYLDDGNPTIIQLRGRDSFSLDGNVKTIMSRISYRRGFAFGKNILTIYDDINNPAYNICGLHLDIITANNIISSSKGVIIVGTNVNSYCVPMGLSEDYFIMYLDRLMQKLRRDYPEDDIVYIAHGRENKQYAQLLCEKNGSIYNMPTTLIEMNLLSYEYQPKLIIGFGSNALFTLKKIFPSTRVVNILFKCEDNNPAYSNYLDFSMYYKQNGIELLEVSM